MENRLITKDDPGIKGFFGSIDRMCEQIHALVGNCRPMLNGERFMTDKQVSERLRVSRRTLQQWRTDQAIAYILLAGKVLYRESDIEKLIAGNYYRSDTEIGRAHV